MPLLAVLGAVSVFAGALSYQRNQVWGSALAFWEDTSRKSPHNSRALFQLAYAQWQNGDCSTAVNNYERVSKMEKPDDRLLIDWALALDCANKPNEAIDKLRQAIATSPTAHAHALIGMIHGKRGHADEALQALATAEKHDPGFEMTYVYRGNIFVTTGDMARAAAEYQRALALNPNNTTAQQGLAMAQSRR
jgi:tetratricopeptide (TPR) repeat protein